MHLTKRAVESLAVTGSRYEVRDENLKGFLVRIGASGDKSFYYVYRAGKGRTAPLKRLHIGNFPNISVELARDIAKQKAAMVAMGNDPAKDVQDSKDALKVEEALNQFLDAHSTKVKPSTLRDYKRMATKFVVPTLGKQRVANIGYKEIAQLHLGMSSTPYQANRCIALLSKFFSWCEKNGHRERGQNPVAGIEKYPEQKRSSFMGREEFEVLGHAFRTLEVRGYIDSESGKKTAFDPTIGAALKMLMLTGARCMEILTLKWEYIDAQRGIANLPDSKTGAKILHLPPPAFAILNSLPKISAYCFPGRRGGHIVNIKDTWKRLLATAGLSGWRIHDLRHAYASYAACSGKSLPVIGAILGHSEASTTARYAHLADNPVAVAAEETAAQIFSDFSIGENQQI